MKFKIKPADTFIWNQADLVEFLIANQHRHIIVETNEEGCCAQTVGLYKWLDKFNFSSVTVRTSNALEYHEHYNIQPAATWKFLKISNPIEEQLHSWNKNTVFGTLYGRPLWHRLGLTSHLLTAHPKISSVGCVANPHDIDQREFFELAQLWQHDPASLQKFANIFQLLPKHHYGVDVYTPGVTLSDGFIQQTKNIYEDFLIDIVAETFTSGNCFFVTEKTVRPMMLKKPMIVMGSQNYLAYLRQMGFRTFCDFWSEDYDGLEGRDRYIKILELIDTLAAKPVAELERMYWDMQYTLDHNYQLLISGNFNKNITKIS
jgi:hypothetical protein